MPNYQDFAKKARERFQKSQDQKKQSVGGYELTRHAEYKMQQYGLSLQKIKGVIRNPKRIEKGVAEKTIAVMQPVNPKKVMATSHAHSSRSEAGKSLGQDQEIWKQEIWVMYQEKGKDQTSKMKNLLQADTIRIISAWRYPGVSPKNNPIPSEILLELEDELV